MIKLSVDQALIRAKSHLKKNEILESQKICQEVLSTFPKNKRVQQFLLDLNKLNHNNNLENPPQEALNLLAKFYKDEQFSIVVEKARVLTKKFQDSFILWNILGASATQIGMLDQAITAFQKVISLQPNYAEVYNNLGNALRNQGKFEEAVEAYKKAISLKPDYALAYYNLGNTYENQVKLDYAIDAYKNSISLKSNYFEAYTNMGNALKDQGQLDESIKAYKRSISLRPDDAYTYYNLGVALCEQGNFKAAIEAYKKSIYFKPDYAQCYSNLGVVLKNEGQLDESIEAYKNSISIKPNFTAYSNMGVTLQDQGKFNEAIDAHKMSILLNPDYAEAYSNMGVTLQDQGKIDEAIAAHRKSISLKPDLADAHENLSFALLNKGKVKEGLEEYEWRWKTSKINSQKRHFSQPSWDGKKSLKGKRMLLWCEQGLGDTINWSSCISHLTSMAEHCILECNEKLVPLLKRSFPNLEVKSENIKLDPKRNDFDFHLPMGSLYKYFINIITKNKKPEAYLIPDPIRVNFWKKRLNSLGKGPYIGISWKSNNITPARQQNYAPISDWFPVLNIPKVTFINLQYKNFKDDLSKIKYEMGTKVHNFEDLDHYNDLDDVAALCSALDMVVSTKVTPTSIAAGVGTLTKLANWRQSAWNNILLNPVSSSLDIFERNTWETWDNVFRLISKDIHKLTNDRSFQ